MYDETIDVLNAKEVKSPESSEEDIRPDMKMNKFNAPGPPPNIHKFDSSDSSSDVERSSKQVATERQSGGMNRGRRSNLNANPNINALSKQLKISDSSENSETDSNDQDNVRSDVRLGGARTNAGGLIIPPESAYDPNKYRDLKVSPELENLFQHILRYTPQKIDIEYKLMPFIPDYIPAVGDIDAFIKITTPSSGIKGEPISSTLSEKISSLGLTVLDEPAAEQSDSALLHLQMRVISKTKSEKSNMVVKKLDQAGKNSKAIERWIKDVTELHLSKPAPHVTYNVSMPDLDTLMEEWPEVMEDTLNNVGFPPSTLDCSLAQYIKLLCNLIDVPIVDDNVNAYFQALHMIFTLYSAVKSSQIFADRQKENSSVQNGELKTGSY